MVSILLSLLKIILYILLILCSIIIIIIGIVLFVPINYIVEGEKYNDVKLKVKVFWLFKLIRINLNYDSDINYKVKIFWKTILSSDKDTLVKNANNNKKSGLNTNESYYKDNKKTGENINKNNIENINEKLTINKKIGENKKVGEDVNFYNNNVKKNINEISDKNQIIKEKRKKKSQGLFNRYNEKSNIDYNKQSNRKYIKEEDKKENIFKKKRHKKQDKDNKEIFNYVKKIIKYLKNNKETLWYILKQFKRMLKAIFPRKSKILLKLGTGDPATTGYITGMISISYAFLRSLVIEPNFENKQLEGEIFLKGNIFLVVLVYYSIKIILDKKVRKLIFSITN